MSIFSKMKHAFQHLGHDIEKVAKSVANGVESVAKKLAGDLLHVMKDALDMTEALASGNMKLAMQDLAKLGTDLEKTGADAATATAEAGLKTLGNLHLGKGFDHLITDVEKGLDTAKEALNKGTEAGMKEVVNSAEGIVEGSLHAVKDLAKGNFSGMLNDLKDVGESAMNLAADLTPEGMGATIAASTLSALHIGNDRINGAIAGLMHGSVGKVVKAAVETGASAGTTVLASGGGEVLTGAALLAAVPAGGGGGRRGKHGAGGGHGAAPTQSKKFTNPFKSKKSDKHDKKADKKDKKDDDTQDDKPAPIFMMPVQSDAFTRSVNRF